MGQMWTICKSVQFAKFAAQFDWGQYKVRHYG